VSNMMAENPLLLSAAPYFAVTTCPHFEPQSVGIPLTTDMTSFHGVPVSGKRGVPENGCIFRVHLAWSEYYISSSITLNPSSITEKY